MSGPKHTEEEKDKWWKLRNSDPPILPKYIAIRFGVKETAVRNYLRERAKLENVTLPHDVGLYSVMPKLKGKFNVT